jgi:hypothetical protein
VLKNLIAKIDRLLLLTTEQRAKLGEILKNRWSDSWNHTQMLYGDLNFPRMPDDEIVPILTDTQKTVWRAIPKMSVVNWPDVGWVQGFEIGDEVWDEDRPKEKSKGPVGNAAAQDKETTKPVVKK